MQSPRTIVSAFRGIRYHTSGSRDLSALIAPPYDIISQEMQADLYARDPHNFVRIERPLDSSSDREGVGYTQAGALLREWMAEGVLVREEEPALYVLEQEFRLEGSTWRRRGVFACVRLPEAGERYVSGHEGTLASARADRLRLMRACQAMTSPVLAIYEDVDSALLSQVQRIASRPDAVAEDGDGVFHRLWVLRDEAVIATISAAVRGGPLVIADGHHRFETATAYRDEMRESCRAASPDAEFDYALMLITSAKDEALRILPAHRLVSGLRAEDLVGFKDRMPAHFEVREGPVPEDERLTSDFWMEGLPLDKHVFGAYSGGHSYYALIARDDFVPPAAGFVGALDVSVLHRCLLDPLLASCAGRRDLGGQDQCPQTTYATDARQAVASVAEGRHELAFFLRATRVSDVLAVAQAGERMPGKSTYFYPKVPAGLVISSASSARM